MERIKSCPALPLDDLIPPNMLPSLTRKSTGYVSSAILFDHYRIGARDLPPTSTAICCDACEVDTHMFTPGGQYYPTNAIFARLDHQPGLPIVPGQPGILLTTHLPEDLPVEVARPLFVGSPGEDTLKWLYVGDCVLEPESEMLSARDWRGLPREVMACMIPQIVVLLDHNTDY